MLQSVFVLLIVSFICFVVFQYLGDPIRANFGSQDITQERAEELEVMLGLDQPVYVQYGLWLYKIIGKPHLNYDEAGNIQPPFIAFDQPDFGLSYRQRLPVMSLIMQRLPATLELATLSLVISTFLGVLLGMWSALRPRSLFAKSTMVTSLLGISIPTFVLGLLLIFLFSVWPSEFWIFNIRAWEPFAGWLWLPEWAQVLKPMAWWPKLPSFGRRGTVDWFGWESSLFTFQGWSYMILPMITLGFFQVGVMARLTRSGMFEALSQDYIRTAWAKGLRPVIVIGKHALRNVLIPVVTVLGLSYGELIAFSIVTESVFEWPGVGELLLTSVFQADQPMVIAYIFLAAFVILMLNLLVDVMYLFLNPKIRYE
jgi:ABC-type dipeptide/oligopeptide/nickel transport system permease component